MLSTQNAFLAPSSVTRVVRKPHVAIAESPRAAPVVRRQPDNTNPLRIELALVKDEISAQPLIFCDANRRRHMSDVRNRDQLLAIRFNPIAPTANLLHRFEATPTFYS